MTWIARLIGDESPPLTTRSTVFPSTLTSPSAGLLPIDVLGSSYNLTPSDSQAVKVATVYRCISTLVDQVSLLPFNAYREGELIDPQPAITRQPDPFERRAETMGKIISSLAFRGNSYVRVINRDADGNATAVSVLDPDEVDVFWNRTRTRPLYRWRREPITVPDEMLHISLMRTPGELIGVGPLFAGTPVIQGWRQQTEFSRRLFSDSATPSGVIESENTIDPDDATNLKTQWTEALRGTREPAILGGGLTFKTIGLTPEAAQFLDTAYATSADIARAFGIPGAVIDIPPPAGSAIIYQNVVSVLDALVRLALRPYMERIEQAWGDLIPRTWEARFETDALLRGDPRTRFDVYQVGIKAGVITVDEARTLEGLPALDPSDLPEPVEVAAVETEVTENA